MMIENAYHGSAFGETCIHNGRVDQLEDRYLGMVEAPSSNLGTSTRSNPKQYCWTFAKIVLIPNASVFGSARPRLIIHIKWLELNDSRTPRN